MKISYAHYSRPLKTPFRYGERALTQREGICLRLDAPGGTIYSEASPLPGHSREEISQVEKLLQIASGMSLYEAVLDDAKVAAELPPSLRFALEGFAAQAEVPKGTVKSNALVPWNGSEITRAEILARQADGYEVVKLKIFNDSIDELLGLIGSIDGIKFRLDANRALTEEALSRLFSGLEKIGPDRVEYLEEPLAHWRHPILARSPIPLAADECAADPRFWRALLDSPASVFVLKPTVAGGLSSLAKKALVLEEAGKKVVYTTAFEVEPGRRSILSFLLKQSGCNVAGVSTGSLFLENYLPDRPLWKEVPAPSTAESTWLDGLPWKEGP